MNRLQRVLVLHLPSSKGCGWSRSSKACSTPTSNGSTSIRVNNTIQTFFADRASPGAEGSCTVYEVVGSGLGYHGPPLKRHLPIRRRIITGILSASLFIRSEEPTGTVPDRSAEERAPFRAQVVLGQWVDRQLSEWDRSNSADSPIKGGLAAPKPAAQFLNSSIPPFANWVRST